MYYFCYETIIGNISIYANQETITKLCFGKYSHDDIKNIETKLILQTFTQLTEYLNGSRKRFDIKLEYTGSAFQVSVWKQLQKIPYGKTKTYKEIACDINNPNSSLPVGRACSKNPIPILIPCHRVIGTNGKLTGYAGGIKLKEILLKIESTN